MVKSVGCDKAETLHSCFMCYHCKNTTVIIVPHCQKNKQKSTGIFYVTVNVIISQWCFWHICLIIPIKNVIGYKKLLALIVRHFMAKVWIIFDLPLYFNSEINSNEFQFMFLVFICGKFIVFTFTQISLRKVWISSLCSYGLNSKAD